MPLEGRSDNSSRQKKQTKNKEIEKTGENGKRDALLGTRTRRPIQVRNSFAELSSDDDDDDEDDDNNDDNVDSTETDHAERTRNKADPNRRQRAKRRVEATNSWNGLCPIGDVDTTTTTDKEAKWYVWSGRGRTMAKLAATQQSSSKDSRGNTLQLDNIDGSVYGHGNGVNGDDTCNDECCNSDYYNHYTHNNIHNYHHTITTHDHHNSLKPGDHAGTCNCHEPQSSRGSVSCSSSSISTCPWQPSQCHVNWSTSSGLSAVTDPALKCQQELAPYGGDGREVMSPAKGPPMAKLTRAETFVPSIQGTSFLQGARAPPAQPGGSPQGTGASGYIPGHPGTRLGPSTNGAWLLPARVDEDPCDVIRVQAPKLAQASPQGQRCRGDSRGARHPPPVVAPHPADHILCSQKKHKVLRRSAAEVGSRRPMQLSNLHSVSREVGFEDWKLKTPVRTLVDSGVEADLFEANPTPLARPACRQLSRTILAQPPSQGSVQVECAQMVPDGYRVYIKNKDGETAWTRRRKRTSRASTTQDEACIGIPTGSQTDGKAVEIAEDLKDTKKAREDASQSSSSAHMGSGLERSREHKMVNSTTTKNMPRVKCPGPPTGRPSSARVFETFIKPTSARPDHAKDGLTSKT